MLTEAEARALLRAHAASPALLATALAGPALSEPACLEAAAALERWIARQDWRETPRGWLVAPDLAGYRFQVDLVPDSLVALNIVAGHRAHPGWQVRWWVEGDPPPSG